jgi:metallophosphoesterase (TIGR00282 family)
VRLLFVGDVFGKPGRRILAARLAHLQAAHHVDFTVVNAENVAAGRGITPALSDEILAMGVDVLTSGNHIWAQRGIEQYLDDEPRLLRPANYPAGAAGTGVFHGRARDGLPVQVINLQGRVNIAPQIDCPFQALDDILEENTDPPAAILVDFHAETTSEKQAMGWYADGKVSAVVGTHTHVRSADARLLPAGTAFCTDVGMTGSQDSIIGSRVDRALYRFVTGRPARLEPAKANSRVSYALVDIDTAKGRATGIETFYDPPGPLHDAGPGDPGIVDRIFN